MEITNREGKIIEKLITAEISSVSQSAEATRLIAGLLECTPHEEKSCSRIQVQRREKEKKKNKNVFEVRADE